MICQLERGYLHSVLALFRSGRRECKVRVVGRHVVGCGAAVARAWAGRLQRRSLRDCASGGLGLGLGLGLG